MQILFFEMATAAGLPVALRYTSVAETFLVQLAPPRCAAAGKANNSTCFVPVWVARLINSAHPLAFIRQ